MNKIVTGILATTLLTTLNFIYVGLEAENNRSTVTIEKETIENPKIGEDNFNNNMLVLLTISAVGLSFVVETEDRFNR